jgi:hypothetical protein
MIPRRYEFTHHLALWEELEDKNDDHCCAAKMEGEPDPTGRAILFDTRNNKDRQVLSLYAPGEI